MRRLITADDVTASHAAGTLQLQAAAGQTVVTPGAWSKALELGVTIDLSGPAENASKVKGVTLVRGSSVQLAPFPAAGADRNVRLSDVITGKDGSPMTAGFMAWNRADSFPWKLSYDEVDYVLEGVLHLGINGGIVEARPGDVLHIPKGSSVTFGTPNRVKVFYVTYPADWAASK